MEKLIIVGLGGGGYTAGIYAGRYNLSPILIWANDGWMITENPIVENFPWYKDPTSWYEIMQNMKVQAETYGAKVLYDTVKQILPIDENDFSKGYTLQTDFNWQLQTKALILAVWTEKVKLWVAWEKEFFGRGVSYCATCDGFFYKGKTVAVVWWWDTAMIEALYLSEICQKVYLIHRRNQFRGEPIRFEKLKQKSNVQIITPAKIEEIGGNEKVEWIKIKKCKTGETVTDCNDFEQLQLQVDGVFIAIGTKPNPVPGLDKWLERDNQWYIKVDSCMKTNLPGVFAAGDCTTWNCKFRQLVVACAEWAVAAESAFKYLEK